MITVKNGAVIVGSNPDLLAQRLVDYQERMGIAESESQLSETADSLLCLTLDRLIREDSISLSVATLEREIPVCDSRRLFLDRQMDIANQRFWFGEILQWTQAEAEKAGIQDTKPQLIQFLKGFNPNFDSSVEFSPDDPVKQRQLLETFYNYSLTDQMNGGSLGISAGLIKPETQDLAVKNLITSKAFLCSFSNDRNLNLPDCYPSLSNIGSNPIPQATIMQPTTCIPQPEYIYGCAPKDVKIFVQRYSMDWNQPEVQVLGALKTSLDIPLSTDPSAAVWQEKIKEFQKKYKLPEDGKIILGGTTEANLATEIFGAQTPSEGEEEGIPAIW